MWSNINIRATHSKKENDPTATYLLPLPYPQMTRKSPACHPAVTKSRHVGVDDGWDGWRGWVRVGAGRRGWLAGGSTWGSPGTYPRPNLGYPHSASFVMSADSPLPPSPRGDWLQVENARLRTWTPSLLQVRPMRASRQFGTANKTDWDRVQRSYYDRYWGLKDGYGYSYHHGIATTWGTITHSDIARELDIESLQMQ